MTPSTTSRNRIGARIRNVVIPLAFWLGVWQLAALWVGKQLLLPGPLAVAARLWELAGTAVFWRSALMSLGRIFGGFAAGAALGALLAALTCAQPWAGRLIAPAVKVIRATPGASFIVLVLLWAPTGRVPAVVSALMVLPVLWGNVCKGIGQTDPKLLEAAGAYRFSTGKKLRLIYVPCTLPYVASGCATALGLAWKAGVAAEVLCQPALAIGKELYRAKITLDTPALFAWTAAVIALSFVLEYALGFLFRRWGKEARV